MNTLQEALEGPGIRQARTIERQDTEIRQLRARVNGLAEEIADIRGVLREFAYAQQSVSSHLTHQADAQRRASVELKRYLDKS